MTPRTRSGALEPIAGVEYIPIPKEVAVPLPELGAGLKLVAMLSFSKVH